VAVEQKKPTWRDIWIDPILRTNLWAAILIYSEAAFNYYLLTFYLKYFPGNIYENSTFFACSDLIAFVLCGVFLQYTSMKTSILAGAVIGGFGGAMYLFMSNDISLVPIMICGARIGQSIIFNTAIISVNRLFPTTLVATAYGLVNSFAHTIATLSPFVAEIKNPYPFLVFEALIGIAIFCSFFITEISTLKKKREIDGKSTETVENVATDRAVIEKQRNVRQFESQDWVVDDDDDE